VDIGFPAGLPAGATVFVTGTINGSPTSFQLSIVDGEYVVPRSILDQFTVNGRYSIRVDGVPAGQSITANISGEQMFVYDPAVTLNSEAASATAANGSAFLVS